jgi:hypothetical protein
MSWRDLFRRQPKDKRSMNSTEVSKTIDPERYPDLLRAGGLAPALQSVLEKLVTPSNDEPVQRRVPCVRHQ